MSKVTRIRIWLWAAVGVLCAWSSARADVAWKDTADAGLAKQVPAGYRVAEDRRGDLNGDGADDCALVILGADPAALKAVRDEPGTYEYNSSLNYGVMVFFKEGGGWRLAAENRAFLGSAAPRDCGNCPEGDKAVSCEIKKGVLYVKSSYQGAHGNEDAKLTFRYRNSEMELIGYDLAAFRDRFNPASAVNMSVNFPAKKKLSRECAAEWAGCDDGRCRCPKYKEEWSPITPKDPVLLRKMTNIAVDGLLR